jgi:hypothetical protein
MDAAEGSGPWGDYPRDAAGSGDPAATGRLAAVLLGSGEDVRAVLTWRPLGSASQKVIDALAIFAGAWSL